MVCYIWFVGGLSKNKVTRVLGPLCKTGGMRNKNHIISFVLQHTARPINKVVGDYWELNRLMIAAASFGVLSKFERF